MNVAVSDRKCGACHKNEVCYKKDRTMTMCSKCGVPLCLSCRREVRRKARGQDVLGVTTSPLNPGERKKILCPSCFEKADDLAEL